MELVLPTIVWLLAWYWIADKPSIRSIAFNAFGILLSMMLLGMIWNSWWS